MGPSASGKTDLAIQLAQVLKARLISVDSALIYQGMDIGTAKPSAQTLAQYPHYLIDICTPEQSYSAYDFIQAAKAQIQLAFDNQQVPILVGGTAFYFHALEFGLSNLPASTVKSKAKFNQLLADQGTTGLYQYLKIIDIEAANRIHPNDSQRIMRALEVFELSGQTLSTLQGNKSPGLKYPIKKIILIPNRAELHQRIEARFLTMMNNGFLAEVSRLQKNPNLHKDLPSMRCVGYRQAWQYLAGEIDKNTLIEKAIIATRQLCRRQSTWFKRQNNALILTQNMQNVQKSLDFMQNI